MADLVVSGGLVVTPEGAVLGDVVVEGETIALVAEPGAIDATGGAAFSTRPGRSSCRAASSRTRTSSSRCTAAGRRAGTSGCRRPEGATRAAIFGGTTTVLSFAFMAIHVTEQEFDARVAVEHRREVFTGRSYADFAFHPVLTGRPPMQPSPASLTRSPRARRR